MKILLCLTLILILVPVPATPTPYYGLAMAHPEFTEDLTTLRVEWWYTWGGGGYQQARLCSHAAYGA